MTSDFYFAYGSNMDPIRMRNRCPDARPVGVAALEGWAVSINARGVATVVPEEDGGIEGVLWEVTNTCLESLDRCEGVEVGLYRRAQVQVVNGSQTVSAIAYIGMTGGRGDPRPGYLETILRGADHFGISPFHRLQLERLISPESAAEAARQQLAELSAQIESGRLGRARPWGGADIAIVESAPASEEASFYPPPTFVITPWPRELSWLFAEVARILQPHPCYTHISKFWVFDRLATAATAAQPRANSAQDLLREVLVVAFTVIDQLSLNLCA